MNNSLHLALERTFDNLDRLAAFFGSFVGLIIIIFSLIGKIDQISIGFALSLTSILYLIIRSQQGRSFSPEISLTFRQKTWLDLTFFIISCGTTVIWYNQLYSRPLEYFILLSVLSGLISIDILDTNNKKRAIFVISKILFLALLIRTGIYYNFPSVMGFDAYEHTMIANLISTTGSVPPFEISGKYVSYPILHNFLAITKLILCVDIKEMVFFSIGLASIISTLFIFIIVDNIAGYRIGLLSVLIFCLSNETITTGITNITAGSLAICYLLNILYIYICCKGQSYPSMLILFIISIVTIVAHQISAFVVLLCLSILNILIYITKSVLKFPSENYKVLPSYLLFFGIAMIYYWMVTNGVQNQSFFETVLAPFIDVVQAGGGEYGSDALIIGRVYSRPITETLVLQGSYLVIPFFAIGGIYSWLIGRNTIKNSFALTATLVFFLVYAIPLMGIRNLLTARWMPFLTIFLGILAAVFIILCISKIKENILKCALIFIVIFSISFIMVTTPGINKDHPLVAKDTTVRNQFSVNEVSAITKIQSISDENIYADPSYIKPFLLYGGDLSLKGQEKKMNTILSFRNEETLLDISKTPGSFVVLRKCTIQEPIEYSSYLYGYSYAAPLSGSIFATLQQAWGRDLIFTNGNVIAYYSNF